MIHLHLKHGSRYYIATYHLDQRIGEIERPKIYQIYEMIRTMSILMWVALITLSTFLAPVLALVLGGGFAMIYPSANYFFAILFISLPVLAVWSDRAIKKMAKTPNYSTWECPDFPPEGFLNG